MPNALEAGKRSIAAVRLADAGDSGVGLQLDDSAQRERRMQAI